MAPLKPNLIVEFAAAIVEIDCRGFSLKEKSTETQNRRNTERGREKREGGNNERDRQMARERKI